MQKEEECKCRSCPYCHRNDPSLIADERGVMMVEILDPNMDKILKGLEEILPPMNLEEVFISLNDLRVSSGIIKVAAEHKPNNPKLWAKCLADARSRFKVCPSAYCNAFAAKTYKKKGGTWKTVKKSGGKK